MNDRPPSSFERPPFPSHMPLKSNLEAMVKSMLMAQQNSISILSNEPQRLMCLQLTIG